MDATKEASKAESIRDKKFFEIFWQASRIAKQAQKGSEKWDGSLMWYDSLHQFLRTLLPSTQLGGSHAREGPGNRPLYPQ